MPPFEGSASADRRASGLVISSLAANLPDLVSAASSPTIQALATVIHRLTVVDISRASLAREVRSDASDALQTLTNASARDVPGLAEMIISIRRGDVDKATSGHNVRSQDGMPPARGPEEFRMVVEAEETPAPTASGTLVGPDLPMAEAAPALPASQPAPAMLAAPAIASTEGRILAPETTPHQDLPTSLAAPTQITSPELAPTLEAMPIAPLAPAPAPVPSTSLAEPLEDDEDSDDSDGPIPALYLGSDDEEPAPDDAA